MNKLSKISLTALCGSLATLTAVKAGELSIAGSATMTMTKKSGATTGNPLGMKSNITFSGSGELDGGQTVGLNITHNDKNVYSSADMSLTTNSLGTWKLTQGTGGAGIGGYDDNMPRAFEEAWDTGIGSGVDLAKGVGSSTTLSLTTPAVLGTTLQFAWAPRNDGAQNSDKGVSGTANAEAGNGYDIVLDSSQDFGAFGADLFVGYSTTEQPNTSEVAGGDAMKDREEGTAGLTLSLGPVKAGYQRTLEYTGQNQVGTDVFGYKNTSWGVSFNVNDNLSISYAEFESLRGLVEGTSGIPRPVTTVESIQAAYTMGGVSLKVALNDLDNGTYTTGSANDAESSLVLLSLAF